MQDVSIAQADVRAAVVVKAADDLSMGITVEVLQNEIARDYGVPSQTAAAVVADAQALLNWANRPTKARARARLFKGIGWIAAGLAMSGFSMVAAAMWGWNTYTLFYGCVAAGGIYLLLALSDHKQAAD